jgi:hypothetical protein
MDFGKAFGFAFKDPDWIKKLAIGSLITLLSVLIVPVFLLLGYQVAVARNVNDGIDDRLPEWSDWGRLFMDGLYVAVANIIYALPIIVIAICFAGATFVLPGTGNGEEVGPIFIGVTVLFGCLTLLFSIALAFLSPAIFIQYVRSNGNFGSLLRVGEVIAIARENLVDVLLTIVANFVASLVVSLVTSVLAITICGALVASLAGPVWLAAGMGHLYGQIARRSSQKPAAGFA